jgi:hypothetical protein
MINDLAKLSKHIAESARKHDQDTAEAEARQLVERIKTDTSIQEALDKDGCAYVTTESGIRFKITKLPDLTE